MKTRRPASKKVASEAAPEDAPRSKFIPRQELIRAGKILRSTVGRERHATWKPLSARQLRDMKMSMPVETNADFRP